jgi:NADH-quinone oxidoreductase subunit N
VALTLAAAPVVNYSGGQAWSDLLQIAPIVILTIALLVGMTLDLVLPRRSGGPAVAVISALGYLAALIAAVLRWNLSTGGPAYSGFMSGDSFALFFEILFAALGILTVPIVHSYVRARGMLESELHVLVLAASIGMMVLSAATSLVTVFLGLETLSIALYIASGYSRRETTSQEAAAKYLLVGSFASAFVLYGMALVYGATGTTVLPQIAKQVTAQDSGNALLLMGVLLMGVGFAFKISGAPFHMWTPDVYQGAPIPVTAFMSVGTKAAAFAMIIRVFAGGLPHLAPEWQALLAFVAAVSMVVGNLMAIVQGSVKRILAYSGVAHAGYILVGVLAGGKGGIGSVLFYLLAYLFMNFGAFAVVSVLATRESDNDLLTDLDGFGYRHPFLGVLLTIFMLSLAGFPPTAGFIAKFFVFEAGVAAGYTWLVILAVLTSVVSVFYYLRIVIHVWTRAPEELVAPEAPGPLTAVLVSAFLSLALGIYPTFLFGLGLVGAGTAIASTGP